jgi:hypothetical protein
LLHRFGKSGRQCSAKKDKGRDNKNATRTEALLEPGSRHACDNRADQIKRHRPGNEVTTTDLRNRAW